MHFVLECVLLVIVGLGIASILEDIKKGLARRDERDEHRGVAPLKQADDAVMLDTSNMSIEDTVNAMVEMIRAKGLLR